MSVRFRDSAHCIGVGGGWRSSWWTVPINMYSPQWMYFLCGQTGRLGKSGRRRHRRRRRRLPWEMRRLAVCSGSGGRWCRCWGIGATWWWTSRSTWPSSTSSTSSGRASSARISSSTSPGRTTPLTRSSLWFFASSLLFGSWLIYVLYLLPICKLARFLRRLCWICWKFLSECLRYALFSFVLFFSWDCSEWFFWRDMIFYPLYGGWGD